MKAIIMKEFGPPAVLFEADIPRPEPSAGEVLVQVKAIGIDRIDVKTRRGEGLAERLRKENPMILGWDIAGIVVAAEEAAEGFGAGDAVFGTVNFPGLGHAYAQYAVAPAKDLALKPDNVSFAEAAAATQSPLTAMQALVDVGRVGKGDRVLIHGASGGVGSYAVQIAKNIGAYVIATASGRNEEFVKRLGADEFIDYRTRRFEDVAHDMDFVLDSVGGDTFVRSLSVLAPDGTIVLLPSDRKDEADGAARERGVKNYRHILMHSDGLQMKCIASMLADGSMKAYVGKTFPFSQMRRAHEEMERGDHTGKVVVTVEN